MELTMNIRLRRLQWVGHVMSFKEKGCQRKPLKGYMEGRRPVGRPRGKLLVAVEREAKRMFKCRNWKRLAEDREAWSCQVGFSVIEENGEGPS
jgi:hypothetical protein